jgi:predicted nucleotide-binding protein/Zn-dependent protease with chaperone function
MASPSVTRSAAELGSFPETQEINPPVSFAKLQSGQRLDLERIRDHRERFYLTFVWLANIVVALVLAVIAYDSFATFAMIAGYGLMIAATLWISWKLTYAMIYGNSIEVGPNQYPQIYAIVKSASEFLEVPLPTVLIMQGHGVFELFVAKRFTRRGLIIVTSNMLDEFCNRPTSREFMMFIGRQLGHIKAGHFKHWFFTDVIGCLAIFFHQAYWRRCHFTADRIGLLAAGDLNSAEQALCILTVGARSAPGTNIEQVNEQRTRHFESIWSWLQLSIARYPYIIDRITRLRTFATELGAAKVPNVGAVPLEHYPLKPVPLLIIHGHDRMALLELKDFLYSHFPFVVPRLMVAETAGAASMPEKFEDIAGQVSGAIAIVTPDDLAHAQDAEQVPAQFRARQNVVVEIGWVWGRFGRKRCLILLRGPVEMPSDLSGVDCHAFKATPQECGEAVRSFVEGLSREVVHA